MFGTFMRYYYISQVLTSLFVKLLQILDFSFRIKKNNSGNLSDITYIFSTPEPVFGLWLKTLLLPDYHEKYQQVPSLHY